MVVDTETRHLPEIEASQIVLTWARRSPARLIYKKTDSTLRGNIYAELSALAGLGPLTYVPAYPKMGRTVVDGRLLVNGIPVEQTSFADDPHHPITDGSISRLLRNNAFIAVEDANTDQAMDTLASKWIHSGGFAAGPCGLLYAAAKLLGNGVEISLPLPLDNRACVVSGSRHACSLEQLSEARQLFESGAWAVTEVPSSLQAHPKEFARELGRIAASQFRRSQFNMLIIFGGETAFATLQALGVSSVETLGEIAPGVPMSRMPDGKLLITKAGGFGPPDLLLRLHRQLHGK